MNDFWGDLDVGEHNIFKYSNSIFFGQRQNAEVYGVVDKADDYNYGD